MTAPDPYRHDDAAYVLDALDDAERAAFEQHLGGCGECRERVAQARATVGLLAGVPEPAAATPEPDTLLPGLLRAAARERRRRRGLLAGLAAVAAACAVALVVALVVALWPSGSAVPRAQAFTAVRPSSVTATASLVATDWGTEIELHCRYAVDVAQYRPYVLLVTDRDGRRQTAGSWTLAPGGTVNLTAGTSLPVAQISRLEIASPDGTPILRLDR